MKGQPSHPTTVDSAATREMGCGLLLLAVLAIVAAALVIRSC